MIKRDISNHSKCNRGSKLGFTGSSVKNIDIQVKAQRVEHTEKLQLEYTDKKYLLKMQTANILA